MNAYFLIRATERSFQYFDKTRNDLHNTRLGGPLYESSDRNAATSRMGHRHGPNGPNGSRKKSTATSQRVKRTSALIRVPVMVEPVPMATGPQPEAPMELNRRDEDEATNEPQCGSLKGDTEEEEEEEETQTSDRSELEADASGTAEPPRGTQCDL